MKFMKIKNKSNKKTKVKSLCNMWKENRNTYRKSKDGKSKEKNQSRAKNSRTKVNLVQ